MKLTETGAGQGESQWEAQMQEQLLEALEDYRRGIADAPCVFKWSVLGAVATAAEADWQRKELGDESSPMTFVASTEEVDRHGDVVSVAGWKLDAYRKNPVFLWAHDYARPAIGRATQVWTASSEAGRGAGHGPGADVWGAAGEGGVRADVIRPRGGFAVSRRLPEGGVGGLPPAAVRGAAAPSDGQVPRHTVHRAGAAGGERCPGACQRERGAPG